MKKTPRITHQKTRSRTLAQAARRKTNQATKLAAKYKVAGLSAQIDEAWDPATLKDGKPLGVAAVQVMHQDLYALTKFACNVNKEFTSTPPQARPDRISTETKVRDYDHTGIILSPDNFITTLDPVTAGLIADPGRYIYRPKTVTIPVGGSAEAVPASPATTPRAVKATSLLTPASEEYHKEMLARPTRDKKLKKLTCPMSLDDIWTESLQTLDTDKTPKIISGQQRFMEEFGAAPQTLLWKSLALSGLYKSYEEVLEAYKKAGGRMKSTLARYELRNIHTGKLETHGNLMALSHYFNKNYYEMKHLVERGGLVKNRKNQIFEVVAHFSWTPLLKDLISRNLYRTAYDLVQRWLLTEEIWSVGAIREDIQDRARCEERQLKKRTTAKQLMYKAQLEHLIAQLSQ